MLNSPVAQSGDDQEVSATKKGLFHHPVAHTRKRGQAEDTDAPCAETFLLSFWNVSFRPFKYCVFVESIFIWWSQL